MNAPEKLNVYSAQEAALIEGRRAVHDNVTERALRLFERVRSGGQNPRISLERAVCFTESFKETEGQPIVLRWAKALLHTTRNLPITIFEDELIVGRPNNFFGKHGIVYPELDGSIMLDAVAAFRKAHAEGKPDAVIITDEDERIIRDVLAPYWTGKDFTPNVIKAMPEEARNFSFGPDKNNIFRQTMVIMFSSSMRSSQNWVIDHGKLLERGLKGIREEARARLAELTSPFDLTQKAPFLEAVILTCDALSIWAKRYSEKAAEMAATEKDPQRKAELLEIAEVCAWVPENPCRTFRDAIQAQWFSQCFSRLEEMIGGDVNQGRMDQYLWPYYQADIEAGRLTEDKATELFHCLWINMMQYLQLTLSPSLAAGREGFSHHETVTIGGQTREGEDATNELSYVLLESTRSLRTSYPELSARIHSNTPDRFLHAVVEANKDGKGSPKIINDEHVVPFYLSHGIDVADALDYAVSGCMESRLPNIETHKTGNSAVNYGSIIEMTLRDGRVKIWNDHQFGLKTGDPRTWTSFDQVWAAFKAQTENVIKNIMIQGDTARKLKPRFFAAPYASMMHDLANKACMDLQRHDEVIPGTLDLTCIDGVGGFATAIDSLVAIKTLIFDQKKLTWSELLDAMECNWEGKEAIRQMCLNAPKFGNGDEWIEQLGKEVYRISLDYVRNNPKNNGTPTIVRIIPITFHVPSGRVTMATPTGRPAGEYLSEGISPTHGMDVKGPTVTMNAMAHATAIACKEKGPNLINMKFAPANIAGEAGTRRLMQIIRHWVNLKLWHVQFNVINRDTLLAAQRDPEKFRDLVVRIAGYCAYFVELTPMQQAEILARTEEHA
jgi:pyruvate formate-lyase/glycerol dehydratase family glycyl radical enzyme